VTVHAVVNVVGAVVEGLNNIGRAVTGASRRGRRIVVNEGIFAVAYSLNRPVVRELVV